MATRHIYGRLACLGSALVLGACSSSSGSGGESDGGASSSSHATSSGRPSSGASTSAKSSGSTRATSSKPGSSTSGASSSESSTSGASTHSHGSHSSSESSGSSASARDGGTSDAGADIFAGCSLSGGCIADCSPPASDPIATGNAGYDQYDGCILAGMQKAGMTEAWQGKLLKSQAYNESGITPLVTTNDSTCGGQNCGIWAISAGTVSGDSAPGPCGSSSTDPFTGQVDYSHSYGLFQQTPACEGTFLQPSLPSGYTCTATTKVNNVPFGSTVTFYCESATSIGVSLASGATAKGYINAVQDASDPLYATSIFNPAYDLYVYLDYTWASNFAQANAQASGCTEVQQWYLSLAYWLTGNATTSCTLTGDGLQYVRTAITDYETVLYNSTWPYSGP